MHFLLFQIANISTSLNYLYSPWSLWQMEPNLRCAAKNVWYSLCEKQRLWSGCANAQPDHSYCSSLYLFLRSHWLSVGTGKDLIRLLTNARINFRIVCFLRCMSTPPCFPSYLQRETTTFSLDYEANQNGFDPNQKRNNSWARNFFFSNI